MADHLDAPQLFGLLAIILATAKGFGLLAQRSGQPAVLGELLAGVVLGTSVLGLVNPQVEVLHLLSELGVALLLFEIGLETDLYKLLQVGGTAAMVAFVGVALPFALGYGVCWILGYPPKTAVAAGATLTATSIGITARVLADLGRLQDVEGQIILGAAVLDDVIGLIILTIVQQFSEGADMTAGSLSLTAVSAIGFVAVTLVVGQRLAPWAFQHVQRRMPDYLPLMAVILAFGLAWLAHAAGSAVIIGAFAAGLLLARTPQVHDIERGVKSLGQFFVPLFFVTVGAQVDVRVLNPVQSENWPILGVGALLLVAAVLGKVGAGYAPYWFRGRKSVIGVGMVPRGEVGLIFAQMGHKCHVFLDPMFSAVTLVVMLTTLLTPPWLRGLFSTPAKPDDAAAPTSAPTPALVEKKE